MIIYLKQPRHGNQMKMTNKKFSFVGGTVLFFMIYIDAKFYK